MQSFKKIDRVEAIELVQKSSQCKLSQEFKNGPYVQRALEHEKYSPLVSRINIPPWSYLDAAAAGPAAATSAAASALFIYYVVKGGRKAPSYKYMVKYIKQN